MNKEIEDKNTEVAKTLLAFAFGALLVGFSWYYVEFWHAEKDVVNDNYNEPEEVDNSQSSNSDSDNEEAKQFVSCLASKGVVVYALDSCPACASLAEQFGGKDIIEEIYVECTANRDRCGEEKLTGFVPEIHINGELYEGSRSPVAIGEQVGCIL